MTKNETIRAWLNNELKDEDLLWDLPDLVRRDPMWNEALHQELEMFSQLRFFKQRSRDTLAIARDEHEIDQAEDFRGLILNMPLPHEGPKASLKAVLGEKGIFFYADIPYEERRIKLCRWGEQQFVWRDRVLNMTFQLVEQDLSPTTTRRRTADDICSLAFGTGHSRALEFALEVIEDIRGFWVDILANAAHSFEYGLEVVDEEQEHMVADLVRLRIHLDLLARRLRNGGLDLELGNVDELLFPHRAGTLVIDDRNYRRLLEEGDVSSSSWWGYPQHLDEVVPRALVLEVLESLRATTSTNHS